MKLDICLEPGDRARITIRSFRDPDELELAVLGAVALDLHFQARVPGTPRVNREPWTAEQMLKAQPGMPREVAEFQVAQINARMGSEDRLEREVPSVSSAEQLREMNPVEVFAARLDGRSNERQIESAQRYMELPPGELEVLLSNWPERVFLVLGTVPEGEHIVHVVYRQTYTWPEDADSDDEIPPQPSDVSPEGLSFLADRAQTPLEFATLRRQRDGSWRVIADHNFLGIDNTTLAIGLDYNPDQKSDEPGPV